MAFLLAICMVSVGAITSAFALEGPSDCPQHHVAEAGCCPVETAGARIPAPRGDFSCCLAPSTPEEVVSVIGDQKQLPSPLLANFGALVSRPTSFTHLAIGSTPLLYRRAVFDLKTDMRI